MDSSVMHTETTQVSKEVIHIADFAEYPVTITKNFTRFQVLNCANIFECFTIQFVAAAHQCLTDIFYSFYSILLFYGM